MVKVVRRPLTDMYGRDFKTWEVIVSDPIAQEIGKTKRIENWLKKKQKEAVAMGRTDGKIYVEGFGWVS